MTTEKRMNEIMKIVDAYKAGHIGRNACYKLIEHHVVAINKARLANGKKNLFVFCLA